MSKSIYTEYTNLTEEHKAWLDECGATWQSTRNQFTAFKEVTCKFVCFQEIGFYQHNVIDDTPFTGSEFCEQVAEILGSEKPRFGKSYRQVIDQAIKENYASTVTGSKMTDEQRAKLINDQNDHTESHLKPNYPHRTYRVLESLDGIPYDARIPLSEWVPPPRAKVLLITSERYFEAWVQYIDNEGIRIGSKDLDFFTITDGHWMRIV